MLKPIFSYATIYIAFIILLPLSFFAGCLLNLIILGYAIDLAFFVLPQYKRVNKMFVIRRSFSSKPMRINMVLSMQSYKAIRKHHKQHEVKWAKYFKKQIGEVFSELSNAKYENKIFFIKTHTTLRKKLYLQQKLGNILIEKEVIVNKRYLYETFKFPFKQEQFYEITFRILPK